ncbi:MAG TPA: AarF/UbiB family protein [Candidatus Thermoplasmatota archaeon]|nr:AarF/UbiB family protein [Candidatus Thermoplasmatota archaeon]
MPTLEQAVPRSRLARFNEILNILVRNDFWSLLRGMTRPAQADGVLRAEAPARLRAILEELGPTFIKIGQLLATRPDLVPQPYVEEFRKLYDNTAPSPFPEVRRVVREDLGREVEELFATFEPQAIASASIGQVHRATLKDGTRVAVKVQHVGIEEAMRLDFDILQGFVTFIEKTFARSRIWQPTGHLAELRLMLEREFDYGYERKNMERVAHNLRHEPAVHIPHALSDLCSRRVLVMEYLEGVKFTRLDDPRLAGMDLKKVARTVTLSMARQIFLDRFFHADPSPGNLLILPPDRVAFLDFGAVGVVTERRAKAILRMITGIAKGDVEGTSEAIVDLCEQRGEYDAKRFTTDVEKILDFVERESVSVADPRLMDLILNISKQHHMLLPPDFVLISRSLFQFEGFCRTLDPDFELVEVLEPFAAEILWKNVSNPKKQKEMVEETVSEMLRFLRNFPHTLNTLIRKVERNELSLRIDVAGMEGIKQAQGRGVLKTSFTVLLAGLLVGLGIVYAGPEPGARLGPFLFVAGVIMAVWTVVMILWSEAWKGRRE